MTVREMLDRIDARELDDWRAWERIYGTLGPERHDLLHAITASTVANVNRGKGKPAKKLTDFMPKWSRPVQSTREQLAVVYALNAQLGGTVSGQAA